MDFTSNIGGSPACVRFDGYDGTSSNSTCKQTEFCGYAEQCAVFGLDEAHWTSGCSSWYSHLTLFRDSQCRLDIRRNWCNSSNNDNTGSDKACLPSRNNRKSCRQTSAGAQTSTST